MELEDVKNNFLITVTSNSDFDSYPKNTGNRFTTKLIRPLKGLYKVALLSLTFQLDAPKEEENVDNNSSEDIDNVTDHEEDQIPRELFFDPSKSEDQVTITHIAEVIVETRNHYTSVLPLMDEINTSMNEVRADFSLQPIIHDKGVFTKLSYNDTLAPGFEAVLPDNLARALGFDKVTHFQPGEYTSTEVCDDDFFNQNFDTNATVVIYFAGYKPTLIKINEPASDDVHDVVDELSHALSDHSIGVGLDDSILHIRIYNEFYSLRLSKRLNAFFGADPEYEMKQSDNVLFLPSSLFKKESKKEDLTEKKRQMLLSAQSINKIFVCLNIIRAQQVGTAYIPYIQVIDRPISSSVITHKFEHPVYIEANTDEICTITLSLKTEANEDVRTGIIPTVAVLYFTAI